MNIYTRTTHLHPAGVGINYRPLLHTFLTRPCCFLDISVFIQAYLFFMDLNMSFYGHCQSILFKIWTPRSNPFPCLHPHSIYKFIFPNHQSVPFSIPYLITLSYHIAPQHVEQLHHTYYATYIDYNTESLRSKL